MDVETAMLTLNKAVRDALAMFVNAPPEEAGKVSEEVVRDALRAFERHRIFQGTGANLDDPETTLRRDEHRLDTFSFSCGSLAWIRG